ncbi:type II toxin-antitoxin system RelE/ParE family toxin [Desulfonatronum thiodismutans]|uniref:type II toxin-antitoxin system RelE/ParE family toxin n=1 Tax=Desulfonatronum thiodismutans TaxID=159290 RepID=UPI000A062F07|nr:type II toxin-antitoxin system RelE/ParE family toxin [Desulfonatronum thiodismutans]
MQHIVRFRKEAETDIENASVWYEKQFLGLGHEFLDKIDESLDAIQNNPLMYPVVHRDTRRALIGKFPFAIYYRILDGFIIVVAVMHGSRNPLCWKERN